MFVGRSVYVVPAGGLGDVLVNAAAWCMLCCEHGRADAINSFGGCSGFTIASRLDAAEH